MEWIVIGLIIAGALFLAAAIIIVVVIVKIKNKFNQFKRHTESITGRPFDTGKLVEDMSNLRTSDVMKKNPASLNGMDKIFAPMIKKDYPDLELQAVFPQVELAVKTYLDCIEDKNTAELESKMVIAPSLVQKTQEIIRDIESQDITVYYDNIVVHKTVISDYVKEHGMATIRFQCAVGYLNFVLDKNGKVKSGSREVTEETVYVVSYSRLIDGELGKQSGNVDVLAVSCPNCGAPVPRGSASRCPYCRTEFHNLTEDVFSWAFTDIKEKNLMTKKLF